MALAQFGHAQPTVPDCSTGRYATDVFPAVTKTPDVIFGYNTARDYSTGGDTPVTLKLDFYEPIGDDAAVARPLIILAFGGSFVNGQRTDLDDLCRAFARKGYATATIDYRLLKPSFFNLLLVYNNPALLADEIVRAANDMRAAVRYFRHDAATANAYRIDPAQVFVGGFSAGSVAAMQVAYTDNVTENPDAGIQAAYQKYGGLEGDTDLAGANKLLPAYSSAGLAGVVSIAGGINDVRIVSVGNPPLYSAQGTADEVIPYASCGAVYNTQYVLCGASPLQAQASQVGIANKLYPITGGNHSSPRSAANSPQVAAEAAAFLQPLVCPAAPLPVVLTAFAGQVRAADCTGRLTWRTATEHHSRRYEVQASADGRQFAAVGTVPSQNRPAGAEYAFQTAPLVGRQYFRLSMLDENGTAAYSPVVTLTAACLAAPLILAPNPARSQVQVSGLPAAGARLFLHNSLGQCVLQINAEEVATLPIASLPPGVYLLKAVSATGAAAGSARLVKE
ncbi:T9SS type A sorting domain-containing protein [Hymenobacter sp. H14-R3]|uniref:T9SS type A sorting domain-containing protein n=1 Tax=Hymenobacter sp. H14-R3 TaxID=3046308 RepID=UPI0024B88E48|nr:T9SS type A sorting domain-containing protein [Hymenobacter sp. H14-R3]MDJ0367430.1 T9SS type A sorting domain-containing protein [Hymenobacter sp. H14-R3]